MFRYLLVRENVTDNRSFPTLQEARDAQRKCPSDESTGIVRVSQHAHKVMSKGDLSFSYESSADASFILLTIM